MKLWKLTWVRDASGRVLHRHPKIYDNPGNVKRAVAFHHHLSQGLEFELEETDVKWRKVSLDSIEL